MPSERSWPRPTNGSASHPHGLFIIQQMFSPERWQLLALKELAAPPVPHRDFPVVHGLLSPFAHVFAMVGSQEGSFLFSQSSTYSVMGMVPPSPMPAPSPICLLELLAVSCRHPPSTLRWGRKGLI